MKWIDLFQFLNQQANDMKNLGHFPWQENIEIFDFETLCYYPVHFIQMPNTKKISLSVDISTPSETLE